MEILSLWFNFWGRVWVPPDLRHLPEPVILHLSDTPESFFSALPGLIRQLNPTWIIHTGDLVDDIKLGLNPAYLEHYTDRVRRLIRILESSSAEAVFLCLGNHDDCNAVSEHARRSSVISSGQRLVFDAMAIGVAHYAEEALAAGGDICAFGHNFDRRTDLSGTPRLLNGLQGIYLILPRSGRIYELPYPAGTDDQRLGRGKVGL